MTPARVGPYEVLSELGRGGMGVVYRVRHAPTGAARALKVLQPGSHAIAVERFKREVAALAKLGRSGVVAIHDAGIESGRPFYAMELMPGGSLRARLEKHGAMPWREAVALAIGLARTLERCHALGLVHRDLKPENVLFDDVGDARLADFGCVKELGAATLTKSGQPIGTLLYMSPEQMNGRDTDARSDVFALAVVLHELVAGEHPWGRSTPTLLDLLAVQETGSRPRLAGIAGVPGTLDVVLDRALAAAPERRTSSAAVFRIELEAVLAGRALARPSRGPRALLAGLVLVALGVAAAVGAAATRRRPPPPAPAPPAPVAPADPIALATAWELLAQGAEAAGRSDEAAFAAARALEALGDRGVEFARSLRLLRARALGRLGRIGELGSSQDPRERVEELHTAADALTDIERWSDLVALRAPDTYVRVRQAWARHRLGGGGAGTLPALVSELERLRDLEPGAAAALEGLRARAALVRPLRENERPQAVRSEMQRALETVRRTAPDADPRLLDRAWDLALLESIFLDRPRFGSDLTASFVQAIRRAALAVAGEEGGERTATIETLACWLWPLRDERQERRLVAQALRTRADAPAPAALARAIVVAQETVELALSSGEPDELRALIRDMKRVAATRPDALDESLGLAATTGSELHPHAVAAFAAAVLASNVAEPAPLVAVAREELRLAAAGELDDSARTELAVVRFVCAVLDGAEPPALAGEDPAIAGSAEEGLLRGEALRLLRRYGEARQAHAAAESRTPRAITWFFAKIVKHDAYVSKLLATLEDHSEPDRERARARGDLARDRIPYLGWLRTAAAAALEEK